MSDESKGQPPDHDAQTDFVDQLRSVLVSVGPGRGYVSLNKKHGWRASAIANLKKTERDWDDAFGIEGAYQLFMDCIIAAQHIDPMALEIPDTVPSNQKKIYRNLLSVDIAKSTVDLPLPLPPKDWQGFYDQVRKLFVDVVVSRLALDQLDHFIESLMCDAKISYVLDCKTLHRETLDHEVRHYASRHPRYDGYYDLDDTEAITVAIEKKSTTIDLLKADIRHAVREAQRQLVEAAFPSRMNLLIRIKEKMTSSNFNQLLEHRWRTTHDLLARVDP